jgi:hypothetical protein
MTASDNDVRVHLYERFVAENAPPSVAETAAALGMSAGDAAAAYRRLAEGRVLVLHPGTDDIWMLNPLSAIETPFTVRAGAKSYYGNCIWDALGIASMLDADARISTLCPDCDEPLAIEVRGGTPRAAEPYIAHFAVPASHWWDDIGYT